MSGEPLQYVLGTWPFRHLELTVDRRVLIPRPETEQMVDVALTELARLATPSGNVDDSTGWWSGRNERIAVDLGTGSGAIALALATEGATIGEHLAVWATDISPGALAVAEENRRALGDAPGASHVHLVEGSWFAALPPELAGRVDLVVSNPPYVAEEDLDGLDPAVRDWEPRQALVAGTGSTGVGGMAAIEEIIRAAPAWLRPAGALVFELDPRQAAAARDEARRAGFGQVAVEPDLCGRDRVLVARR
jgi:release factor glutamine methyltransferase